MKTSLFCGDLVRLSAEDPEPMSKAFSRWARDTEYHRMLNYDPVAYWSEKKWKSWLEKDLQEESQSDFFFSIRALDKDLLIGFIGLMDIEWANGNSWVVIGVGERDYWGKGYGTDAMRLVLRYAFHELNLYRVSLGLFEYNLRALKSYQKAGFTLEGRYRQLSNRDGSRWDVLIMGVRKPDWEKLSQKVQSDER